MAIFKISTNLMTINMNRITMFISIQELRFFQGKGTADHRYILYNNGHILISKYQLKSMQTANYTMKERWRKVENIFVGNILTLRDTFP